MRISRPHMFMQMAEAAAMRSTCFRGNVGAVVVRENDVVSMGYNGPLSGEDHCHGNDCPLSPTGGCIRSVHAEKNAIERAKKKLMDSFLFNCEIYCTYSPCVSCAELILRSRIGRMFYRYSYRVKEGLELLGSRNFEVYRISPAGYIIEEFTGKIVDALRR